MNIQFVITGGGSYRDLSFSRYGLPDGNSRVYIIEVNPRSSRTIPFISKVTNVPMVPIAINVMRGQSIVDQGLQPGLVPNKDLVAVKAPVFSMSKLTDVDTFLGPEMKSTGEVMGIDRDYPRAVGKALIAGGLVVPDGGGVLLSIADIDKADAIGLIRQLHTGGHPLYATPGTSSMIEALGIPVTAIHKILAAGHPNVVDVISDGTVKAVINTVTGERRPLHDGFHIRRTAADHRIPCFTSIDTARAAMESIRSGAYNVMSLDEYLAGPDPEEARRNEPSFAPHVLGY
jgi:carbamoyl-phosphate synthase large subunit